MGTGPAAALVYAAMSMKRLSWVLLAALGLSLTACGGGGGGGDQDAFCDALDAMADQIGDGDLSTEGGLEDLVDTANDLREAADDGEQADAVRAVGEELAEADPDDAADTFEVIDDELGDFVEDCDVDLEEPEVPETTTTTTEPVTTTTTEVPDTTTTSIVDDPPGDAVPVNARQPVPPETTPEFAALAQGCFDGDMAACDELFRTTPIDSVEEAYGETCGGRLGEAQPNQCTTLVVPPVAVPAEVADQATAGACFGGDMVACDALFQTAADGSIDEAYGALCAGRVENTEVLCVDIFGDVAFQ